ncbi:hypothetical protein QYE76_035241 [Lolium multiflorum]|uniref:Uncharacterized protein n=1 Tax=Lolium multiflorum TaxID=4521 RepID=A0AAD8VP07_LOLMU|nr:hypothetical protein QYE76_035241 [Lolium multiflorum]
MAMDFIRKGTSMGNFRGHNPETGMVHSHKSRRPRRKFITSGSDDDDEDYTDKDYSVEEESNQLVLYEPRTTTHRKQREVQFAEPIYHSTPLQQRSPKAKYGHSKVLPSIGAYTVQCADCFKWRIVPTKEKYEELRETISQQLFVCARACEWNRPLSCDDPEDMSQDENHLWALDKPEIPQPPPGWDRDVRIRAEGCSKFADVYYTSPSGTTLRSMVEIGRYLAENPYYIQQGVNLSQFSMLTPQPLQADYIRKRKYPATRHLPEPLEPFEVSPLASAPPPTRRELLRMGTSASNPVDLDESEVYDAPPLRTKKRTPRQASPSSSEHTRSTVTTASSSGEPKKRSLKQVSSSRRRPTPPPSWPHSGRQPQGSLSDIEHVEL